MDRACHTLSEIDKLLQGDLSDIEELEDIDLHDEVDQIMTEDHLLSQIQELEEHLAEEGIIFRDDPASDHADGEVASDVPIRDAENDDFVSNIDELPLFDRLSRREQIKWRKARDVSRWRDISPSFVFPNTEANIDFQLPLDDILLPKDYFTVLIDEEIINNLAFQTNLYSVQKTCTSINTTNAEIEQFLGIPMLGGIVKMPSLRMFWSSETRYSPIADCMACNRFELFRRMFHINDNSNLPNPQDENHDKLFKIRPFIDAVRQNFNKIELEEKLSIDELIIPFKGRAALKQYNPNKPHKWGIKVFALASSSGIIHDFEIYVGRGTVKDHKLGISGDIVLRLIEIVPKNQNYKLFIDNWFNSHGLLCELKTRGVHTTGTIRKDWIGCCPFESDQSLRKKGRGNFQAKIDTENKIIACKWYDNKAVCLASTCVGPDSVEEVQRWSANLKERVPVRPAIVGAYNSSMGGIDLHDMLVELYRIDFKVKRYYFRIFYHIIDMVKAWLLYRRHLKQIDESAKPMPLVQFKVSVAYGLMKGGQNKTPKRGRRSAASASPTPAKKKHYKVALRPVDDVRYDNVDHWPIPEGDKRRCKVCIKNYSTIKCGKCDVHLCLNQKRNCFIAFLRK